MKATLKIISLCALSLMISATNSNNRNQDCIAPMTTIQAITALQTVAPLEKVAPIADKIAPIADKITPLEAIAPISDGACDANGANGASTGNSTALKLTSRSSCNDTTSPDADKFYFAQYNETHEILVRSRVLANNLRQGVNRFLTKPLEVQRGASDIYGLCANVCQQQRVDYTEEVVGRNPFIYRCTCAGALSTWWFKGYRDYEACPAGDLRSCHIFMKEKIIVDTYLGKFNENQIKDIFKRGQVYDNNTEADNAVARVEGGKRTLENEIDENGDRTDTYNHEKIKEIRGNFQTTKDINNKFESSKADYHERPYFRRIENYRKIINNDRQREIAENITTHNETHLNNLTTINYNETSHGSPVVSATGNAASCNENANAIPDVHSYPVVGSNNNLYPNTIDKDQDEFDLKDFAKKKLI